MKPNATRALGPSLFELRPVTTAAALGGLGLSGGGGHHGQLGNGGAGRWAGGDGPDGASFLVLVINYAMPAQGLQAAREKMSFLVPSS
jgi:hypothetical protein